VNPSTLVQSTVSSGNSFGLLTGLTVFSNVQTIASSKTVVSSSANPSVAGQTVTFTATVIGNGPGTPTGTVQFAVDGGNVGGPVNISTSGGITTASFSSNTLIVAGSPHTISATYS